MADQTRNTRLAIMCETTEGEPIVPTAGTDFVAVQPDFTMAPVPETLTNEEFKGSLAPAKSITGRVTVEASGSFYLRHSGTEGTCPNYGELLESAFGLQTEQATERDTVGGSTDCDVEVDTGEGTEFLRGQAILVKDATNGYSIRPVESIAGDTLTTGFTLPGAPAAGVDLGRACTYSPEDCDQKTNTIWQYLGNGVAVQAGSGMRTTSIDVTISAGELINANYSLEGINYYYNPITIDATNDTLDFTDDGGPLVATVAQQTYTKAADLATALETSLNAASADTYTVTYSNTDGKFTIATSTSSVLTLAFGTGPNTGVTIAPAIGFDVADETGALTYTSDSSQDLTSPFTPSFDSPSDPLVAKDNVLFIGDKDDNVCIEASSVSFTLGTPKTDVTSICAKSGVARTVVSERTSSLTVTALLEKYDADKVCRLLENTTTRAMYAGGIKDGAGNWIPGRNFMIYMPTASVISFTPTDVDGLVAVDFELQSFADDDGDQEVFLSFV